jgi:pimeloyl-ACP methyl ester carboxylesterase
MPLPAGSSANQTTPTLAATGPHAQVPVQVCAAATPHRTVHTGATSATLWPLYTPDSPHAKHALAAEVLTYGPATGTPVVFLHGLVGLNDHWEDLVDRVKPRLRCVLLEMPLLDIPGEDCSIEAVTRITERFMREQIGQPAVLVGNSFGGHVALRLAIEQPHMVKGLVLAGSSGLIEKSLVSTVEIRPTRSWLKTKIDELYFDPSNVRDQDVDRAFEALSRPRGARAMVKLSRSARRDVLRSQVGKITAPTLLVWGRQDVVTPPEAAEGFAQLIPSARLVWADRCGHVPMAEGTETFARELLAFCERLGVAPGA